MSVNLNSLNSVNSVNQGYQPNAVYSSTPQECSTNLNNQLNSDTVQFSGSPDNKEVTTEKQSNTGLIALGTAALLGLAICFKPVRKAVGNLFKKDVDQIADKTANVAENATNKEVKGALTDAEVHSANEKKYNEMFGKDGSKEKEVIENEKKIDKANEPKLTQEEKLNNEINAIQKYINQIKQDANWSKDPNAVKEIENCNQKLTNYQGMLDVTSYHKMYNS